MYAIRSYYDRERCIQCARCIRFQDEIAGEAVEAGVRKLGFEILGKPQLGIMAFSHPDVDVFAVVITSYSIHYTKLYENSRVVRQPPVGETVAAAGR